MNLAVFFALVVAAPPVLALLVYSVELATGLARSARSAPPASSPSVAVLIPAHDEAQGIGKAVARSGRRVVLLASGSMSHRFWPLSQLEQHEASDPIHISRPEAREADLERLEWFYRGDHAAVVDTMPEFLKHVPEARFGHYLMMAGALGGRQWKARGRRFSEYENATGTSQVHVWFDRPETGWN